MKGSEGGGDFDRRLEGELRRTLRSQPGPSPRAAQAAYRRPGRSARRLVAVGGWSVALVAAAALALGGGAAAAMATGSPNPVSWGQRVVQAVHACRDRGTGGPPDVGRCVDGLARQPAPRQPDDRGATLPPTASPSPPPTRHIERAVAAPQLEAGAGPSPGDGKPSPTPDGGRSQGSDQAHHDGAGAVERAAGDQPAQDHAAADRATPSARG